MQKIRNLRVYAIGVLTLTLLATVLRTLALTLSLDRSNGYFRAGTGLPIVLSILLTVGIGVILLFPALLRDRVPTRNVTSRPMAHASSILCAVFFFIAFISTCTAKRTVALPTLLWLVGILTLLAATVYFLAKTPLCPLGVTGTAVFGSLTLIATACLITVTYFDVATPMNAPAKTHLHLALLAAMLCLLYELRDTVGVPLPRMRVAFTALAFFLGSTVGISDIILALAGYSKGFIYLSHDLLLLGLALYAAARGAADLKALSQTERNKTQR